MNAVSETILASLPRGIEPPQIISYNATNVPVAQLNVFSDTFPPRLFDYGLNFIRIQLFTIPGFSSPAPLGGVSRSVMVNLDRPCSTATACRPTISATRSPRPTWLSLGHREDGQLRKQRRYQHERAAGEGFQSAPGQVFNGAPVFLGDVANVTDTHQPQTNVVRVDGQPATYLMVIKHADASTLAVVDAVKAKMPDIRATAPKG